MWATTLEEKKNRIDGNSLKHEIVFIPSLEKLQGTFCLSNPFDSGLNTNGGPKGLGMSSLISYSKTDFITIIACLPGSPSSWQPFSSKTLNILADNCCSPAGISLVNVIQRLMPSKSSQTFQESSWHVRLLIFLLLINSLSLAVTCLGAVIA